MSEAQETQTHNFQTEAKQLLQLMIHSLYSNKEIFLRELISNSSDAIDKLRFKAIEEPDLIAGDSDYRIDISFDKETKTLVVADNGIGMSEEAIAKLFQPFSQAEESTTRVYGGTGLGMTITKTLVDLMNGSIDVKSTPGEGTTFTVTLPVVETEGPDNDPDISGLNVLALVDDDMSRKRLSRYIELPGASIRFFETEAELKEDVASKQYLVFLIPQ